MHSLCMCSIRVQVFASIKFWVLFHLVRFVCSFVRSFAVEFSNVCAHTYTHTYSYIHMRAPASYSNKYSWGDAFDCVWCGFFFFFGSRFKLNRHTEATLSLGDQIKWKQKQATTVSKRTLYWSRHTFGWNESMILLVLRLFYSAVSAREICR